MKPVALILATSWILSLGAAFLIGRGGSHSDQQSAGETAGPAGSRLPARPARNSRSTLQSRPAGSRSGASSRATRIVEANSPRAAVVELAQLSDPVERAKGFLALLESLEPDEFLDVVADFRALGITEQRMSEYGMILHAWGKADPEGALGYALKNTGTPFARQAILASWAADDPTAAIAYAQANHQGEGANPLLVGIIRGLAPNDLHGATNLLEELPYSRERGDALQSILPLVLREGAESAIAWTNNITDERLKSGALSYIIGDISEHQPARAAELLVNLGNTDTAVRVADDVAGALARNDLNSAITWSEGLEPQVRAEAVEGIITHYASQDVEAASQWLASLEGSTNLDPAIRSFAWHSQSKNPELAADWVGRIQNENRRNEMYQGVLSRWWRSDAAAAEQWIQSTPDLPERIQTLPDRWKQPGEQQRDLRRTR